MTNDFDKYVKGIMAELKTIKRKPTAGRPEEIGQPKCQKEKETANIDTKIEKNKEAEDYKTSEKPVLKSIPEPKRAGITNTLIKPGALVDTETIEKHQRGQMPGAPQKGKYNNDNKAKTSLKPGKMISTTKLVN